MLLHLVPRFYADRVTEPDCALIDVQSPELGLTLRGGIELMARRPFPNKNYLVACRKEGRKAVNGLFVETSGRLREFTVTTRWAAGADTVVTHRVLYVVLDDEFGAVTEDMSLWYAIWSAEGGFASRWPASARGWSPAGAQPCMELDGRDREGHYTDRCDATGRIIERSEVFQLHTVEPERLTQPHRPPLVRIPAIETAFPATVLLDQVAEDSR